MFSFLHSTKFQCFFYGFKSQLPNWYDNWYVQKHLKGIFHKGMLLIWKGCFTHAILSFRSPRCATITHLNVIYTKFTCARIAQLNKTWHVWTSEHAIACHSQQSLNLVSDNIKISTYCTTDIDSISNLLRMEFIFKWPIIERPCLPISERQDALGMRLYIWQYIWIFYLSS